MHGVGHSNGALLHLLIGATAGAAQRQQRPALLQQQVRPCASCVPRAHALHHEEAAPGQPGFPAEQDLASGPRAALSALSAPHTSCGSAAQSRSQASARAAKPAWQ